MPRSGKIKKRVITEDPLFKSQLVSKITNCIMKDGEKSVAQKQVYRALEIIREKGQTDPLALVAKAVENIKPVMEVRPRRIGGAAYQVPQPVRGDRRESLAIRWLVLAARSRSNKEFHTFADKLAAEFIDASNEQGLAIKKKLDTHRMAEANKAFAHFRW